MRTRSPDTAEPSSEHDNKRRVVVNVSHSKYQVVRDCVALHKWALLDEKVAPGTGTCATPRYSQSQDWDLWWQECTVSTAQLAGVRPFQRINHWPGMEALHTKTGLARTLRRISAVAPSFAFSPQTYVLPDEWIPFMRHFRTPEGLAPTSGVLRSADVFICKPASSCQGKGILLTRSLHDVDPRANSIAQQYIGRPFLIEGLKFDLRIYVLLSSVNPLRVWLFEDGLVRFATSPYAAAEEANMLDVQMHLTNYAVNKGSANFVFNEGGCAAGEKGSKRTLKWFRSWLDAHGHNSRSVWGNIADMIVKTMIAAQPHLAATYRRVVNSGGGASSGGATTPRLPGSEGVAAPPTQEIPRCFEILGLDVLLDSDLKPWLLEVNHSPSFTCDTRLDLEIKTALISETMGMLGLEDESRRRECQEKEAAAARRRLLQQEECGPGIASARGGGAVVGAPLSIAEVPSSTLALPAVFAPCHDDAAAGAAAAHDLVAAADPSPLLPRLASVFTNQLPAGHIAHEHASARGYKLIYPLPPAESLSAMDRRVWATCVSGALAAEPGEDLCSASLGAGPGGKGSALAIGRPEGAAAALARSTLNAMVGSDSGSPVEACRDSGNRLPTAAGMGVTGLVAIDAFCRDLAGVGVHLVPHDASPEALLQRGESYAALLQLSQALYTLESSVASIAMRRDRLVSIGGSNNSLCSGGGSRSPSPSPLARETVAGPVPTSSPAEEVHELIAVAERSAAAALAALRSTANGLEFLVRTVSGSHGGEAGATTTTVGGAASLSDCPGPVDLRDALWAIARLAGGKQFDRESMTAGLTLQANGVKAARQSPRLAKMRSEPGKGSRTPVVPRVAFLRQNPLHAIPREARKVLEEAVRLGVVPPGAMLTPEGVRAALSLLNL